MANGMKPVTDPELLKQLNTPVTDPETLNQLESGFSFSEMLGNIPESAKQVATDTAEAVMNPIDSAQGIGSVLTGYAEKFSNIIRSKLPNDSKLMELSDFSRKFYMAIINTFLGNELGDTNTPSADAMNQHFIDRYGSVDQALETLEKDPAGALLDAASVFSVGAGAAGKARTLAGKAIPEGLPKHMYESAAKFTTTRKDGGVNVQALLDEGIPLTPKGVQKLENLITAINGQIDNILKNSKNANTKVPTDFIMARMDALKNSYINTVEGQKDRGIIEKIVDGFKDELESNGKTHMTISELNDFKKNTYGKVTDWNPAKGNKRKTKDQAFKELSAGARDVVESMEPETKNLNQRQAPLLDSREKLQRAVSRIENRDTIGMGDLVKLGMFGGGGTGIGSLVDAGGIGGGIGTAIGATTAALGRPTTKANLAIALNNMRQGKPVLPDSVLIDALIKAGYGNLALQASQ